MRLNLLKNETSTSTFPITDHQNQLLQHQQITIQQRKRSVTRNSEKRLSKPFYIRSVNMSRKGASPFRKYEECVKQKLLSNRAQSTPIQQHHHHESLVKNVRIEIEPIDSLKIVDNLNKLIIECFDDASNLYQNCASSSSSNVICYKNNYNFNISDSNFNLLKETHNSESTINNNILTSSVIINDAQEPNKQKNEGHLQSVKTVHTPLLESNKSTNSLEQDQKRKRNVRFTTKQLPLGVPENPIQQIPNNDIKINSETAEKFIDLLITEDEHLRKKLASGQVDSSTLNRLERFKEMRERYIEYKSQQENNKISQPSKSVESKFIDNFQPNIHNQSVIKTTQPESKHEDARSNHVGNMHPSTFSEELKRHPLIKNNNYLRYELT
jgi:hypothetical protein